MNTTKTAGKAPASRRRVTPSEAGIRLVTFLFVDPASTMSQSLAAVDSMFVTSSKRASIWLSSALLRLQVAVLLLPIGLFTALCVTSLFTGASRALGLGLYLALPALSLIAALALRNSRTVKRYIKALDILSGGNVYALSFKSGHDAIVAVQGLLDEKVHLITGLKLGLSSDDILYKNERWEQEGQLIQLVQIFDGVGGVYTGPAKTLLRELDPMK